MNAAAGASTSLWKITASVSQASPLAADDRAERHRGRGWDGRPVGRLRTGQGRQIGDRARPRPARRWHDGPDECPPRIRVRRLLP
jgi:hypothetical protein